jgi:subtilisin family serine protease
MKRVLLALTLGSGLCLSLAVAPVAALDPAVPDIAPPVAEQPLWTEPAPSVDADPEVLVDKAQAADVADEDMTVVYAVQEGDNLAIRTEPAASPALAEDVIADVQDQPDVVAVEIDAPRQLTSVPTALSAAADPNRDEQWALDRLEAETAWASSTGEGVTVAVIDSGVAPHPDLAGLFVKGKDFVEGGDGRTDPNGHGTHVAGIIAMTANNNIGGAGLAPSVSIMPVVVADAQGSVRASDSARGIVWAVDHGADVLNMSYSGGASSVEQKAIQYAQSKAVVPVAAAGNSYLDSGGSVYNPVQYPAGFPGVLGVGAVTKTLERSSFSEVGKQVDVVAPGGNGQWNSSRGIFSTYKGSGYVRMPGTSMAAPYASATMALIISRTRALGLQVVPTDVLLTSVTDLGAAGRDDQFGYGLVNPTRAMDLLAAVQAGGALPPVKTSEVATRVVKKVAVRVDPGALRFRIPARGRFVVAWQRYENATWGEPTRLKGTSLGRSWYVLRTYEAMKVRILAARKGSDSKDPIWVSPPVRTRISRAG